MTKQIILCADDYAQNPAISQGIIELIEKKRLSATSCMTSSPYWPSLATDLFPYLNQIDVGLHFNLTEGPSVASHQKLTRKGKFRSLPNLMMKSLFKKIDPEEIKVELSQQISQFEAAFGKLPDFIDGHQHIHHLPIIRQVILDYYADHLQASKIYFRCVSNQDHAIFNIKKSLIEKTGAEQFKKLIVDLKIPHNTSFSGIYSFSKSNKYAQLFPTFLEKIKTGGIILCHPGKANHAYPDPIRATRKYEYDYLISDQFTEDCKKHDVALVRFRDL